MAPKRSENYYNQDEVSETARDRKLRKRRDPRGRDFTLRKKREEDIKKSREADLNDARQKIASLVSGFADLDSEEGKRQVERYLAWVSNSLSMNFADLSEEDVEYKTATASVKAGGQKRQKTRNSVRAMHLPTRLAVRNEEGRSLEDNKKAARENLFNRLSEHLSFWQTLSKIKPDKYSPEAIGEKGVEVLKEL